MITIEQSKAVGRDDGRVFYRAMSLLLSGITAYGFAQTVPTDLAPPGLPFLLELHAVIFIAWMVLFIAQPALIASRNIALHRRLGWLGLFLAVAMVGLGCAAILFALRNGTLPPFYPPGLFLIRGILCLAGFAGLVAAAIAQRRRAEWHKRLILCASIIVITPGLERALPVLFLGPHWYVIVDFVTLTIALIGPAVDVYTRRRVHPAYWYGIGSILLMQIVTDLVSSSPIAVVLLRAVGAG